MQNAQVEGREIVEGAFDGVRQGLGERPSALWWRSVGARALLSLSKLYGHGGNVSQVNDPGVGSTPQAPSGGSGGGDPPTNK